ncbi:hypothetical protein CRE_01398 [Caenorhabditis remanei]|uniref:Uncharacterized protein n=1 Tax=Caenorhabditis remanei TaxID=31234 RepID=E3NHV5_CAERE|nr:hypothetical protein CRE_01398 [Caenorhabditis remanei]
MDKLRPDDKENNDLFMNKLPSIENQKGADAEICGGGTIQNGKEGVETEN